MAAAIVVALLVALLVAVGGAGLRFLIFLMFGGDVAIEGGGLVGAALLELGEDGVNGGAVACRCCSSPAGSG